MNITTLRQRYDKSGAWGMLASIDLTGCDHEMIQSPKAIRKFVIDIIESVKMKRFGPMKIQKFGDGSLEGHSVIQFIETSTIVVHFDDKHGDRAFIDLFSCKFFDPYKAEIFAKKYFKAKKSRTQVLIRK